MILTDEFSRQASMEKDLGIPSALFAAPVREIIELGKSQIGFMNLFAIPLFQGVTDVMPAMGFCVDELHRNKSVWEDKIAEEQQRSRGDSDDSTMTDGMFSPRTMSLATPSDASHQKTGSPTSTARTNTDSNLRIKAMLSKSPFAQSRHLTEADGRSRSLPEISTNELRRESLHPSPKEMVPESSSRRPSKLQLSYATNSAPGLLDHPSEDADVIEEEEHQVNGVQVQPSLVTDAVVVDPPTPSDEQNPRNENKQRSSDTTESAISASGDWTSQATSATTSKMPLSPSTQATSIMSEDSVEKGLTPTAASPVAGNNSQLTNSTGSTLGKNDEVTQTDETPKDGNDGKGVLMETVRNLKKKPSRFRMNSLNFWKRSKSSSPPMPVGGRRVGGSEDESGSHYS